MCNHKDERDMTDPAAVATRSQSARNAANVLYANRSSRLVSNGRGGLVPGVSERELRFSSVRRMFCLITVFDFLLMLLLWIIYVNIIGLGIKNGIICQVKNYNFRTSMFDVVALSFTRMGLLLIAYAAFKSRHWAMVAVTTAITNALILSKVFLYDFSIVFGMIITKLIDITIYGIYKYKSHKITECLLNAGVAHPVDYILLIASFTMAWVEVWAIDFKVVPRERKMLQAQRIAEAGASERTHLLGSEHGILAPPGFAGHQQGFYSPLDSPKDSDSESGDSGGSSPYSQSYQSRTSFLSLPNSQRGSSVNLAGSIEEQECIERAKESTKQMDKVLNTKDGWTMEKESDGVVLESHLFQGINGKVYRIKADVPVVATALVHTLWEEFDNTPQWNSTVLICETLQQIDEHIDIVYTLAAPGPGGVVSSRDFIVVRNYRESGDRHICTSIGVEHPAKPASDKYVRGFNAVGGWVTEPVEGDPSSCRFTWILHSDLKFKVWTPQTIVDSALVHVLLEMYHNLIKHVQETFPSADSVNEQGDARNH